MVDGEHEVPFLGYAWPWTARPGERVDFQISSASSYRAQIARLYCADALCEPSSFREEILSGAVREELPGRIQRIDTGSFILVKQARQLDQADPLTIQAAIFPTCLPRTQPRTNASPPSVPDLHQHLISRWNEEASTGWVLMIDEANRLTFQTGDGQRRTLVSCNQPLREGQWYLVKAVFCESGGWAHVAHCPIETFGHGLTELELACHSENARVAFSRPVHDHLSLAASVRLTDGDTRPVPFFRFNGRMDRVRISRGALSDADAMALQAACSPVGNEDFLQAFWDFASDIGTTRVSDLSVNALHGSIVNLPTRAVTGVAWDGMENDWRNHPAQFSAIHFHDDDLYDARWQTDFSYDVPAGLPSGVYAAKIVSADGEDYIPFFVAPPKRQPGAPVALLLPTATYTAYANVCWADRSYQRLRPSEAERMEVVREEAYSSVRRRLDHEQSIASLVSARAVGRGIYLHHSDGTYCEHASQKYPNLSLKPKERNWGLVADSYIVDWLRHIGVEVDIITDDLLQAEGTDLLRDYRVVISGNHPEYCSAQMLSAIAAYRASGGRWVYLGGNGYFWATSFSNEMPGAIEVRKDVQYPGFHLPFEQRHSFDGQPGGQWAHLGRAPEALVGVGSVFPLPLGQGSGYQRLPDSYLPRADFIFRGVGEDVFGRFGSIGGGAAGQETDEADPRRGTPAHALHLARSEPFPWPLIGENGFTGEEFRPNVKMPRSDLVFFECPAGGAVFSVGSMAWVGSLSHNNYDNTVARITGNILSRFLDPAPFSMPAA